jgi:hypothetical protein
MESEMSQDEFKAISGKSPVGRAGPDFTALPEECATPHGDTGSPFDGLPRYGGIANVEHLFQCGDCQQFLRTTRTYTLPTRVFLWVFVYFRTDEVMKCPRCMRYHILVRLPLTILLANLLSPIVVIW